MTRQFQDKALYLYLIILAVIAAILSTSLLESIYILSPIVISISICIWLLKRLTTKDGEFPIIDIGAFCVLFTALYTTIPLFNYFFGGFEFGTLSDGRLQAHDPSAEELGLFFINHIFYQGSLAFAYVFFRRPNIGLPERGIIHPTNNLILVIAMGCVVFALYFLFFNIALGVGFKTGYGDEAKLSEGSILVQQVNGKLMGIYDIFYASMVAYLILKKVQWRFIIYLMVAWGALSSIIWPGSRGEFMNLLLLSTLFWYKFHGINHRSLMMILVFGFLLFIFLGIFRAFDSLASMFSFIDSFQVLASASNEFQAMLGTGFDVMKLVESSGKVPEILLFNDIIPMLPPQQLLSFEKLSGADWYLKEINQYGIGVGFMWSVISQSLIGFGLGELVLRGGVLGWFLAQIHRWYQMRHEKFLPSVIYITLCLTTLWTFRDTTGAILWEIWWSIIPFVVFIYALGFRNSLASARNG